MAVDVVPEENPVALAREAEASREFEAAVRHWRQAVLENPHNSGIARRLIAALQNYGSSDDAESAAREAADRFPGDVGIALEFGWLAARRKDWTLALHRWEALDAQFPDNAAVANVVGTALTHLGRLQEAEALFKNAHSRIQTDFALAMAYATFPAKRRHWAEAVERLQTVVEQFPNQPNGFAQLGNMLRMAGRGEDAQRLLSYAAEKFPNAASIAIETVKLIEPDWLAAGDKWRKVAQAYPNDPAAQAGYGKALRRAGDYTKAEEQLKAARDRFPGYFQIACEYASLAVDKSDWDEGMRRWQRVVELFPEAEEPPQALARVRWSASFSNILDAAQAKADHPPPPSAAVIARDGADIIERFESLGENCEFGLVQRHYGLEPLGLLRFSSVHQSSLLDLLKTRFGGVGDAEHTRLDKNDNEYLTSDRRYGMVSHTYVAPHSVDQDAFHKEQCKRITFLRRKLVSDLERAEKIFVVTAHGDASDAAAIRLYAALQTYGPNRLLYLRLAEPGVEPGGVRQVKDGLIFGGLDDWGNNPLTGRWNIRQNVWLTLCRLTVSAFEG